MDRVKRGHGLGVGGRVGEEIGPHDESNAHKGITSVVTQVLC